MTLVADVDATPDAFAVEVRPAAAEQSGADAIAVPHTVTRGTWTALRVIAMSQA